MRYFFVVIAALLIASTVHAQVGLKLSFNVGSQPVWGPAGYDRAEFYYLPDIETYYNVSRHAFYYQEGGRWAGRTHLPSRYHHYDLYNSYKVVVNEREPYLNHDVFFNHYVIGRNGK